MAGSRQTKRVQATTPARREKIVEAAFECFLADGFEGTSLRTIAARIGMTHAGLLHHFKSKDELLSEVLDRWDEDTHRWFTSQPEVRSLDDLIGLIAGAVLRHRDEPALIQLMLSLGADASRPSHPAHERMRKRYVTGRAFLVGYLGPLQECGEVDPLVDAEDLASTVMAAMDGLQMQWLLDNDVDAVGAIARMLVRYRPPGI